MKFFTSFLLLLAVSACLADDSTAQNSNPEQALKNILNDIYGKLSEHANKVKEGVSNAQQQMTNSGEKNGASDFIKGLIETAKGKIGADAQKAWQTIEGPIKSVVDQFKSKAEEGVSSAMKVFGELAKCAENMGKSDGLPKNPIGQVNTCITEQAKHLQDVVGQATDGVNNIMSSMTGVTEGVTDCIGKATSSWMGIVKGPACFMGMAANAAMSFAKTPIKFISAGVQGGTMFMTVPGNAASCIAKKVSEVLQAYDNAGIDTNKCIQQAF